MAELGVLRAKNPAITITSCAYVTVGTGIGVGLVVNGDSIKGLMHPEAGHIYVPPMDGDTFKGNCPFHGACLEGMCATPALSSRTGLPASELATLSDDDPLWEYVAHQLAHLCLTLVLTANPEHISLGGGVMNRTCLFPKIRNKFTSLLNGYVASKQLLPGSADGLESYISGSVLGPSAGLIGACYLAKVALG
jgi:fructokinase